MRLSVALILLSMGCTRTEPATRVVLRTDAPPGLFDRVTIEVRTDDVLCDGCRRDLPATALEAEASFSVVAQRAPIVHVTLFRERGKSVRRETSLDVFATFDPESEEVEIRLAWERVGSPQGSWDAPVAAADLSALGHLPGKECSIHVEEGEACVPGGLFWFGDPLLDLGGGIDAEGNDERLIAVAPFSIDVHEVTLAELVASGDRPQQGCQSLEGADAVACVRWAQAERYCAQQGKRLPTEAELEYLMGGLRSQRLPWGEELPSCGEIIFDGRGCGYQHAGPPGAGSRDRLEIGGKVVLDLMGNVSEWTADVWSSTSESCFDPPVLHDPRCEMASARLLEHRVVKGASWYLPAFYLGAAVRLWSPEAASDPSVGFRCARGGGQ